MVDFARRNAMQAYRANVEASRNLYFIDCKMQILSKQLAEEFNKLRPPHRQANHDFPIP
jgi:hypothetical protein